MRKIAIHHRNGFFSERWVKYCEESNIPYKIVDCYSNDIINQLSDCHSLMWHIDHMSHKDALFAKQLLIAVELAGIKVFPNIRTAWHFDDKLGQKYLFESIGAKHVPTYVFLSKKEALEWANNASYPKVFKLRGGAGSLNVKLVRNRAVAKKLIRKSFGAGFDAFDAKFVFKERLRKYMMGKTSIYSVLKWFLAIFLGSRITGLHHKEVGYIYFQDFIPGNQFDIRIIVIGEKAFGLKRMVRKNDFRASGSGYIIYDKEQIPVEAIKAAFEINSKIKGQSIAFDFIFDEHNKPLVVEISFGYAVSAYDKCEGYWDRDLNFYEGPFIPQNWMVEELLK